MPGNDDAIRAIRLYLEGIADAIVAARQTLPDPIEGDADDYIEVETKSEPTEGESIAPVESVIGRISDESNASGSGTDSTPSGTGSDEDKESDQGEEGRPPESTDSDSRSELEKLDGSNIVES